MLLLASIALVLVLFTRINTVVYVFKTDRGPKLGLLYYNWKIGMKTS
jgi:hypothetical protein